MTLDENAGDSQTMELELAMALERSVWDALLVNDMEADLALLHPDFLGVYPTGFATRADHAESAPNDAPRFVAYELSQEQVKVVAEGRLLLTYRAEYVAVSDGPTSSMYVTSLWAEEDGAWTNLFSQDTPAAES